METRPPNNNDVLRAKPLSERIEVVSKSEMTVDQRYLFIDMDQRIKELEKRIGDASIMLYDWDGEYDPKTKTGNAQGLAEVISVAYASLQGKHWNDK